MKTALIEVDTGRAGSGPAEPPHAENRRVVDEGLPHVVFHSALLDRSGYAQVGRVILRGLDAAGVPVRAEPMWGALREAPETSASS